VHGSPHGRERVSNFVRDDGGHLAQRGQRGLFAQSLLHLHALGEIVNDAGEPCLSVDGHFAHREASGKVLAIAAASRDLSPDADHLGRTAGHIVG